MRDVWLRKTHVICIVALLIDFYLLRDTTSLIIDFDHLRDAVSLFIDFFIGRYKEKKLDIDKASI